MAYPKFGYKKDPIRHEWPETDELCYGLELEVCCIRDEPDLDLWAEEEDGSLGPDGAEYVSPPTPAAQARREFAKACEVLKRCGAEVDRTCGAHIHVTRNVYRDLDHALVRRFLYDHQEAAETVFGRKGNHHASFKDTRGKYTVQNLEHRKTVEYRLGAGTLDPAAISLRLDYLEVLYWLASEAPSIEAGSIAYYSDYEAEILNSFGRNTFTPGAYTPRCIGLDPCAVLTRARAYYPALYKVLESLFPVFWSPASPPAPLQGIADWKAVDQLLLPI